MATTNNLLQLLLLLASLAQPRWMRIAQFAIWCRSAQFRPTHFCCILLSSADCSLAICCFHILTGSCNYIHAAIGHPPTTRSGHSRHFQLGRNEKKKGFMKRKKKKKHQFILSHICSLRCDVCQPLLLAEVPLCGHVLPSDMFTTVVACAARSRGSCDSPSVAGATLPESR